MADNAIFKSFDALKISGSIAKKGIFKDRHGKEVNITDDMLNSMFTNFNEPVKLKLSHDDGSFGGYLYKIGLNPETDQIDYEGMMFDSERISRVKNEGFSLMSPEITVAMDNDKFISAEITAGAMCRTAGINTEESNMMNVQFSAPEGDGMVTKTDTTVADATSTMAQPTTPTVIEPTVPEIKPTEPTTPEGLNAADVAAQLEQYRAEAEQKINAYKETIEQLTGKVDNLVNKNGELVTGKINEITVELKTLGIESPEIIGEGLDPDTRLRVLNDFKKQLARGKSLKPSGEEIKINETQSQKSADAKLERARKLGYEKEYKESINR